MPASTFCRRGGNSWTPKTAFGSALHDWYNYQRLKQTLADAAAITALNDLSGNGFNLAQATGVRQPIFRATTGPGSQAFGDFDGSDDHLWVNYGATLAQPFTWFIVARLDAAPALNQQRRVLDGTPAAGEEATLFANGVVGNLKWFLYAGTSVGGPNYDTGTWHTFVAIVNGASSKLYVDGGAGTAMNVGTNGITGITHGNSHLAPSSNKGWDGGICEALTVSRVATVAEINRTATYLVGQDRGLTWTTAS